MFGKLRQRLHDVAPELASALDRSWQIAHDEWLPALGIKKSSYNSYPHLRHVEQHLERIILDWEEIPPKLGEVKKPLLNPAELYLLLAAVLFHDIGRIQQTAKGTDSHSLESANILNKHSMALGIPSQELANSLARICKFHDPPKPESFTSLLSELHEVVIDPYGQVHEQTIAILLALADHMDSASHRVLPNYICDMPLEPIGAFRSIVRGVYFDHKALMIRTELNIPSNIKNHFRIYERYKINKDNHHYPKFALYFDIKKEYRQSEINDILEKNNIFKVYQPFKKPSQSIPIHDNIDMVDWLVINGFLRVDLERSVFKATWSSMSLLAMVLSDIRVNVDFINHIRRVLSSIEMPAYTWLIEYKGHLYNWKGEETFEPIFHKDELKRIADSMWRMSTGVFGHSEFSYESLAAQLRDPNIEQIIIAVRRIAIVTKHLTNNENQSTQNTIWCGINTWRWEADCVKDGICNKCTSGHNSCAFISVDPVKSIIDKLTEPI